MALHFELVSPEKLLFSGDVDQVDVPGVEGDFGVLEGHAALVATLRPGILTVHGSGGETRIVVLGGFAEVSEKGLTIVADLADAVGDFDKAVLAFADRGRAGRDPEDRAGFGARQADHAARSLQGSGSPPARHRDALKTKARFGGPFAFR